MSTASEARATERRLPGVTYPSQETLDRWFALGVFTQETMRSALYESFARHAARVAIATDQRSWTYAELDAESDLIAAALSGLGLERGDRVLFQIGNVPEVFLALYGCWKAGLVPVCTLASHREHEITAIARLTDARAHLVQGDLDGYDLVPFALGIQAGCPGIRHVLTIRQSRHPGATALDALAAREQPATARAAIQRVAVHPLDVAAFQLSGGTTGTPKVIPRLHADYLYNVRACAEWMRFDSSTVCYWPFPAMHNAAMACFNTPTHLVGGTVVV